MGYTGKKHAEYALEWYYKHRELTLERQRQRRHKTSLFLWALKSESCCKHCGESDPICLEFHHTSGKDFNIGSGRCSYSLKRLQEELLRCDIVCSNCHRRLHRENFLPMDLRKS